MQTHMDSSHSDFMRRLEERAAKAVENKASEITVGKEGEEPLAVWMHGRMRVTHMPPDEQGILRISIGGMANIGNYLVFRGDVPKCVELLERALLAIRSAS